MDTNKLLKKLAKQTKYQNLLSVVKEINSLHIFKNAMNLSKLQELFLSYLYFYHDIFTDVFLHKIQKDIAEDDIYVEAYAMWKREKGYDTEKKDKKGKMKKKEVHLVFSNTSKVEEKK